MWLCRSLFRFQAELSNEKEDIGQMSIPTKGSPALEATLSFNFRQCVMTLPSSLDNSSMKCNCTRLKMVMRNGTYVDRG